MSVNPSGPQSEGEKRLTASSEDVVNLLQGQTVGATADFNPIRHRFQGNKSGRRRRRVSVLGDAQLATLLVLEFDLEDAVGLSEEYNLATRSPPVGSGGWTYSGGEGCVDLDVVPAQVDNLAELTCLLDLILLSFPSLGGTSSRAGASGSRGSRSRRSRSGRGGGLSSSWSSGDGEDLNGQEEAGGELHVG
jgi:hypothetical protein